MDMSLPNVSETEPRAVDDNTAEALTHTSSILPVVLAGGSGTRLWPLSREGHPKQLIELLGDGSLLANSVKRLECLATAAAHRGLLVCAEEHRFLAADDLMASSRDWQMIIEPVSRNTAPALTLAALKARAGSDDPVLVVTPADHAITDVPAFERAILAAAQIAQTGQIVTLGVVPDRAECGYGYIELGEPISTQPASGARALQRFVEKPDQEVAAAFVEGKQHWWNSGIFVMRASVWLRAVGALRPDIAGACTAAFERGSSDSKTVRVEMDAFAICPSESIDYAVMERLEEIGLGAAVVPLNAGWSDVGSWDAVWSALPKDESGNVARGDVLLKSSSDTYVHSEGRLVACIGAKNLIVVETADAVLVADRHHAQDVKAVVGQLKDRGYSEAKHHLKVHRPWGHYESIEQGPRFQVKRIVVMPGAALSLQLHYHRAEHWIVVSGTARVTRGEETFLLAENETTYVPLGVKHRLENVGRVPLEMIEVQCGSYLGEDDIVRFEDQYGRDCGDVRKSQG
ncbi:mannose-1-phosphate guanylyltransferase/mannose-6-phosphate isomerase [Paraburkholderia fungorum]|uniref:mannose-1-phosphate guanylyltransferase/mannose-6-phosphate isomerase n=1 Tax=Paraburkholderia fungorum TaxID=134537 RepID=UPI0038BA6F6F